jgi:hypothetical protein
VPVHVWTPVLQLAQEEPSGRGRVRSPVKELDALDVLQEQEGRNRLGLELGQEFGHALDTVCLPGDAGHAGELGRP